MPKLTHLFASYPFGDAAADALAQAVAHRGIKHGYGDFEGADGSDGSDDSDSDDSDSDDSSSLSLIHI